MRDVKQAFREMFRALKPGGTLLTSGDPFRPLNSTEKYELGVFDSHPAVLGGVNEGIPNLEVFLTPIAEFGDAVSGYAVTHALKSPPDGKHSTDLGKGYRRWELNDLPELGESSGSIALHLRKTGEIDLKPSLQTDHVIRAGVYHDAISDLSRTMDLICPVLPDDAVNRPLVPDSQSWFDLLNGWKTPRSLENWRRGFGRGRWFLEKEGGLSGVSFKLGWNGEGEAEFDFLLNGMSVQKTSIISRQGFSIGRLLFRLREKVKPAGIAGRILRRLIGLYPSEKPFHVCQVYFDAPVPGRTAFEIRNLNSSTPDFTVSNRVLL